MILRSTVAVGLVALALLGAACSADSDASSGLPTPRQSAQKKAGAQQPESPGARVASSSSQSSKQSSEQASEQASKQSSGQSAAPRKSRRTDGPDPEQPITPDPRLAADSPGFRIRHLENGKISEIDVPDFAPPKAKQRPRR